MSRHSTVRANLWYSTEQDRDEMLSTLEEKGWAVDYGQYDPANGDNPPVDKIHGRYDSDSEHAWMIVIPDSHYRNLRYMFSQFRETAKEWAIIETSTDGDFTGVVSVSGGPTDEWDLAEWIEDNAAELHENRPEKDEYTDNKHWHSAYTKWQAQCELEFRTTMADRTDIRMEPQQKVAAKSIYS